MNTAAEIHDLALKLPERSRLKLVVLHAKDGGWTRRRMERWQGGEAEWIQPSSRFRQRRQRFIPPANTRQVKDGGPLAAELLRGVVPKTSSGDLLDEAVRRENEIDSGEVTPLDESEFRRGMPRWRERQRSLPVAQKVELIGEFILETRQLERVKRSCKLSATS